MRQETALKAVRFRLTAEQHRDLIEVAGSLEMPVADLIRFSLLRSGFIEDHLTRRQMNREIRLSIDEKILDHEGTRRELVQQRKGNKSTITIVRLPNDWFN